MKGVDGDVTGDVSGEEAAWQELVAHYGSPAVADGSPSPWPDREDLPGQAGDTDSGDGGEPMEAELRPPLGPDPMPGVIPAPPQLRIIRPAGPPLPPAPADPADEDHYVPPDPPPLPRLDPVSKGAWAALFGGPAFLLIAVTLDWTVPSWAAFAAVAAFVGGFATLVVRMGERPPRDSGPDDGAVV